MWIVAIISSELSETLKKSISTTLKTCECNSIINYKYFKNVVELPIISVK